MTLRIRGLLGPGLVVLAQLALAALVARFGTIAPVPMHFNAAGQVDRWGDRAESAWMVVFVAVLTALVSAGLALSRGRLRPAGTGLAVVQAVMLLVFSGLAGLMAAFGFGLVHADGAAGPLGMATLWLVLGAIGAVLGKTPPNAVVGVRTPWSRASRLSWDKSNRLAGRLFFGAGVMGVLLAPLTPEPLGMRASTTVVLIIAGLAVMESWRVWRRDPDRRPIVG
ncbi:MAG TPA: SdpI family protein [Phenylobacterium sp.]|nr:SdpI family protein [Phenylobacterium sp.]